MKKRKMYAAILILLSPFVFSGTSNHLELDATINEENINIQLKESYDLNETLSFPTNNITIDGQNYLCEYFLLTPSNKTCYGQEFSLDEVGQYELTIRVNNGLTYHNITKQFQVYPFFCQTTSESSMVNLTDLGMEVNLIDGDSLIINKTIDLSNVSSDDELINIQINPTEINEADFTILNIKFIDVNDENSYLKVTIQSAPIGEKGEIPFSSYALAGATNQPLTGYEEELGRLHRNNQWGSYFPLSFYNNGGNQTIDIRYDSLTKEVFSLPNYRIIDLDDPDFFTNKWNGFTSGIVNIEITATSYKKNTANFIVKSLCGKPIDSIYAMDKVSPTLTIDYDLNNIPNAMLNKPYPLFNATALDDTDGNVNVIKKVYKNYLKTNQFDVLVKDNSFVPTQKGLYTIEYTAYDKSGNKTKEIVNVNVVDNIENVEIKLVESDKITSGKLGYYVPLAKYSVSGGSGNISVETIVKYNGKKIEIVDNKFLPEYEGNYEIIYTATDYLANSITTAYNFKGIVSNEPVYTSQPIIPKYLIKGKKYSFEDYYAIDYSKGSPNKVKTNLFVSDDGNKTLVKGEYVVSTSLDYLEFIYEANGYELSKRVKVVNVGDNNNLDLTKYFDATNNFIVSAKDNAISFNSSTSGQIDFIRELLVGDFSIKMSIENGKNIEAISLILQDFVNEEEKIKLTYQKNSNQAIFLINNKPLYQLTDFGFLDNSVSNEFTLTTNGTYVTPFGNVSLLLNTYENGKEFKGFSSTKIYVSIIVENASDDYTLNVRNISGQPMNITKKDRIKPLIVLTGDYGGEYNINEIVTIPPAQASDILDPNIEFYLTVKTPSGDIVVDENNVALNKVNPHKTYHFKVSEYGNYIVTYIAKDTNNGQEKPMSYAIICEDKIAPTIYFEVKENAVIGEKIIINNFKIADNYSKNENLKTYVYLVMPNGENILMKEGYYSFVPKDKGIYKIVATVYDEAKNIGLKEVTIRVN